MEHEKTPHPASHKASAHYLNLTTRETVDRLREDGYRISEYALRSWIRTGAIPARQIGKKSLIYYPNVLAFLQCADGQDNVPPPAVSPGGIRRIEV
ncbi:MAG: hypothetical protein IJY40_08705 [Oscillospiraceae bacterium]|nr:hypothetical protein [Oscillospiraceae bacterium]